MPTITVTGPSLGPWDVAVKPWEENLGKKNTLPVTLVWVCKHPFTIEFDEPQNIEYTPVTVLVLAS